MKKEKKSRVHKKYGVWDKNCGLRLYKFTHGCTCTSYSRTHTHSMYAQTERTIVIAGGDSRSKAWMFNYLTTSNKKVVQSEVGYKKSDWSNWLQPWNKCEREQQTQHRQSHTSTCARCTWSWRCSLGSYTARVKIGDQTRANKQKGRVCPSVRKKKKIWSMR